MADLVKVVSGFESANPASAKGAAPVTVDVCAAAASVKRTLDADVDAEQVAPPAKQSKRNAFDAMDGVSSANLSTKDVTVKSELERLHSTGVFREKKRQADEREEVVTKRALFDSNNRYFFGYNPQLLTDKHGGKSHNTVAMTVVATAFDGVQWNKMFDESLDDAAVRAIVADVSKKMNERLKWDE